MTLLAPTTAIIAAALGLPAVALLYMLKLRRRPVRVSSSMFWSQAAKDLEANVPLRWIRPSWLLAMQLLAVALLAMALGRPAVPTDAPPADRVVLIVDRTASTGAVDRGTGGATTAFDRIIEAARDRVRRLDRSGFGGELSLVWLDALPSLAAGPTGDPGAVLIALTNAERTDQPGDLEAALRLARTIARGPDESDRASASIELITDQPAAVPGDVLVNAVTTSPPDNAGIVSLAARRDIDDPSLVRVLVGIAARRAGATETTVLLDVVVPGDEPARVPVRLVSTEDEPGVLRGSVTRPIRMESAGLVRVGLVQDDALTGDNEAGVLLASPPRPAIVLVQPERASLEGDAGWVIVETLRALNPGSLVQFTRDEFAGRAPPPGTDLVILDGVEAPVPMDVATLTFGGSSPAAATEPIEPTSDRFVTWQRDHPIWRGVSPDDVRWRASLRLVPRDAASVLAVGVTGPAAVLDQSEGVRRLTLPLVPAASTWPARYSFALFLANAVEFLTWGADAQAGLVLSTGRAAALSPAFLGESRPDFVQSPDGGSFDLRRATDGSISLGLLEQAGAYRLGSFGPVYASVLSEEETLGSVSTSALRGATASGSASGSGTASEREVWYWFVAAAAMILSVEWLVYAARARVG